MTQKSWRLTCYVLRVTGWVGGAESAHLYDAKVYYGWVLVAVLLSLAILMIEVELRHRYAEQETA